MVSTILRLACPDCETERVVFRNAASTVTCDDCDAALVTPTGGEGELHGEVVEVVQAGHPGRRDAETLEA